MLMSRLSQGPIFAVVFVTASPDRFGGSRLRCARSSPTLARPVLRCQRCGQAIGVYEPLVTLADGQVETSSRAREPQAGAYGGASYHAACFHERAAP